MSQKYNVMEIFCYVLIVVVVYTTAYICQNSEVYI